MTDVTPLVRETAAETTGPVAVLGVGAMGGAVAMRLVQMGYRVSVYDINQATARKVKGARIATTIRDAVTGCVFVLTCLPTGSVLRSIAVGDGGLVESCSELTTVIDLSTVSPEDSVFVRDQLQMAKVSFLDVPLGRTTEDARKGNALAMIGGDEAVVASAMTVIRAFASECIYCGPTPSGTQMKLLNNITALGVLFISIEIIEAAGRLGMDQKLVRDVLLKTNARNGHMETTIRDKVFANDYSLGFRGELALKDANLALAVLHGVGLFGNILDHVPEAVNSLVDSGFGAEDVCAYAKFLRRTTV